MINTNKHMKCKQCGAYNPKNKYESYNSLEEGIVYKDTIANKWLSYDEYIKKEDKYALICKSCNHQGEAEDFIRDKYIFIDIDDDYYSYTEMALCNRHFFKCNCNRIQIENKGFIKILDERKHIFKCECCNSEFSRDEFNSRIKYLTPTEIEKDSDLKESFEEFNNDMMRSNDEMLEWNYKTSSWNYIKMESFFNKESGFIEYKRKEIK